MSVWEDCDSTPLTTIYNSSLCPSPTLVHSSQLAVCSSSSSMDSLDKFLLKSSSHYLLLTQCFCIIMPTYLSILFGSCVHSLPICQFVLVAVSCWRTGGSYSQSRWCTFVRSVGDGVDVTPALVSAALPLTFLPLYVEGYWWAIFSHHLYTAKQRILWWRKKCWAKGWK